MEQRDDAKASHLDLAGQRGRWRSDKASVAGGLDPYLIVGHEPRLEVTLGGKRKKTEREVGFAAAGAAADKSSVGAKCHTCAMHQLPLLTHACLLDRPLCRRQPDHEAGTGRLALGRAHAFAARALTLMMSILRPQPTAMGDDDLP